MAARSCAASGRSSRTCGIRSCSLRTSGSTSTPPRARTPRTTGATRCPSRCSARPPGTTTGCSALEETQLALRSPYLDNDLVRTVYRGPAAAFESNDVCLRLIADGNPRLRQIRTDRGQGGGAAASWFAFLLELEFKAEYAYDYGMPQWMARFDRLLSPLQPERLFLGRHKFTHFRVWYRDALARYVQAVLLDHRSLSRPYLDRRRAQAMVVSHVRGNRNYTWEIHKLLTLELIHRLFLDRR